MDNKMNEFYDQIEALRDELRAHGQQTADASAAALCETSAEVLGGLATAFTHYSEGSEVAWQKNR